MPYYLNSVNRGVAKLSSKTDGTIDVKWNRAFASTPGKSIAYNIYMLDSRVDFESDFFNYSPEFVYFGNSLQVNIANLELGSTYRFAVRAIEYYKNDFSFESLPAVSDKLATYPETLLSNNISDTSLIIPVISAADFPNNGVVKIGSELIQYSSVNYTSDELLLSSILQRGFSGTTASYHYVDGYDGYHNWDPAVLFFPNFPEEKNTVIFEAQARFDYDEYAFTLVDGYKQATKDILYTDLTSVEDANKDFPSFDYKGYHRTDPVALLNGECVGSYFGGDMYCADGYNGVGQMIRGISVQDRNTQRQEILLSMTGEEVCLIRRQKTGIRCNCYLLNAEHPDSRCKDCYGTGFVVGYQQFFNDKKSNGRILIRFEPSVDDVPLTDSGLESEMKPNAWGLVYPAIFDRDFLVRFDQAGNEEYRYEVINVTRNKTFLGESGAQKLSLQRIRKTDIIYQCKVFRDTSTLPTTLATSIASAVPAIAPHSHNIVTNEKHPLNWEQVTSVSAGHSHIIQYNSLTGLTEVLPTLGHTHIINL